MLGDGERGAAWRALVGSRCGAVAGTAAGHGDQLGDPAEDPCERCRGPGHAVQQIADVDGSAQLFDISCPSASLCVATDLNGDVLNSTNPAGGTGAWTDIGSLGIFQLSCPSTDTAGDILSSAQPTGGTFRWNADQVDGSTQISSVSCPATTCLAAFGRYVAT